MFITNLYHVQVALINEVIDRPSRSPKFVWQDPLDYMGDPTLVERLKILRPLNQAGCRMDNDVVMKVLELVQPYITLSRVAGIGKARMAIVGAWKQPEHARTTSKLQWKADKELTVRVEHKGEQGSPGYTTKSVHNSKTLRSAQNQDSL